MKQEYMSPNFEVHMFIPRQPVARLDRDVASDPNHDNGYIDWFADPDASRRGTQE